MAVHHLTSADNPRVKAVVKLREGRHRRRTGLFVAEGEREIGRALAAGLTLREGFWCPSIHKSADPRTSFGAGSAAWFTVSESLMSKMSLLENPPGVLAVFEQRAMTLELLGPHLRRLNEPPLLLVAVGTTKPGNLGAMVRSAEAAGASAVLVSDGVVDLFNPNAIRASTGAVFALPVVASTGSAIRKFLSDMKVRAVAADPAGAMRYDRVDWRQPAAIVIGAEDTGLDDGWRNHADVIVSIPTRGRLVDSLNAATAATVLLFEALRQRDEDN